MSVEIDPTTPLPVVQKGDTATTGIATTPDRPAHAAIIAVLMIYLMASCILLVYALAQLWPEPTPAGGTPKPINFLIWSLAVSDEVRLFYLVALTGALGGMVHTLRSLYWYVGNQQLMQQWLPMYLLLPFVAAALSLIFYLVIRGGFFSPQANVQQTSPFGFVAMAGLIGMFSPQAVLKLRQVAETVLTRAETGKDAALPQPADRPKVEPQGQNGTSRALN